MESKEAFFESPFCNRLYAKFRGFFLGFWILVIATFSGTLIYFLLDFSAFYFLWLNLLLQVFFVLQAFPLGQRLKLLIRARATIMQEGTILGLVKLKEGLFGDIDGPEIQDSYRQIIQAYLSQTVFFWLLPVFIYYLGGLPFLFFYLSCLIQYQNFNLENPLIDLLVFLPYNLWLTILRILLPLLRKEDKLSLAGFKENFLQYRYPDFQHRKKTAPEKSDDAETESRNALSDSSSMPLNLDYLSILSKLYLISVCLILSILIVLLYLRVSQNWH